VHCTMMEAVSYQLGASPVSNILFCIACDTFAPIKAVTVSMGSGGCYPDIRYYFTTIFTLTVHCLPPLQ